MNKKELRQLIRNRKRQFSQAQLEELSLDIIRQIRQHPIIQKAKNILFYYSLPDEVNTHEYILELIKNGKQVYLPVVINEQDMEIRKYTSPQDMKENSFHILEPAGELLQKRNYSKLEVAIIPGMSFDLKGNRLGRGRGYYDRLLESLPHTYKIGICFGFQMTSQLPIDSYDIIMDEIISNRNEYLLSLEPLHAH